ncbi:hypothetical protein CALCODRAFT_517489 [Calocera cornea HHB12733]|uniref:Uncharacterized protein n=1 Tax=Calocera cornea HHB12733 TaxID=1353952 RepID=A0A165FZ85_9BASI|nr:hypothetical protein CALCODRAFT_517489 [Calocera cornea HHB12733]
MFEWSSVIQIEISRIKHYEKHDYAAYTTIEIETHPLKDCIVVVRLHGVPHHISNGTVEDEVRRLLQEVKGVTSSPHVVVERIASTPSRTTVDPNDDPTWTTDVHVTIAATGTDKADIRKLTLSADDVKHLRIGSPPITVTATEPQRCGGCQAHGHNYYSCPYDEFQAEAKARQSRQPRSKGKSA